jgi:hypothetical protein
MLAKALALAAVAGIVGAAATTAVRGVRLGAPDDRLTAAVAPWLPGLGHLLDLPLLPSSERFKPPYIAGE